MSATQFRVATPEQLKALAGLTIQGNAMNTAKVWSASRRRTGTSPLDGSIFVRFSGDRMRDAVILRNTGDEMKELAWLKYNTALHFCQRNLVVDAV